MVNASNARAQVLFNADKLRLDSYIDAKRWSEGQYANIEKTYQLALLDGSAADASIARTSARSVVAKEVRERHAEADEIWVASVNGANFLHALSLSDSLQDWDEGVSGWLTTFADGVSGALRDLAGAFGLASRGRSNAGSLAQGEYVYQSAVDDAAFSSADYAARVSAMQTMVASTNNAPWAQFHLERTIAEKTWWDLETVEFVSNAAAERTLFESYEVQMNLERQAFESDANQIEAGYVLAASAILEEKNSARSLAQLDFAHGSATASEIKHAGYAEAERVYQEAVALADQSLVLGQANGQPYAQADYDIDVEAASTNRDSTFESADSVYQASYFELLSIYDNAIASADIASANALEQAGLDRNALLEVAGSQRDNAMALDYEGYADDKLAIELTYSAASLGRYVAALTSQFGTSPNDREQLEIDLAQAEAARATTDLNAHQTLITASNEANRNYQIANDLAFDAFNQVVAIGRSLWNDAITAAEQARSTIGATVSILGANLKGLRDSKVDLPKPGTISLPEIGVRDPHRLGASAGSFGLLESMLSDAAMNVQEIQLNQIDGYGEGYRSTLLQAGQLRQRTGDNGLQIALNHENSSGQYHDIASRAGVATIGLSDYGSAGDLFPELSEWRGGPDQTTHINSQQSQDEFKLIKFADLPKEDRLTLIKWWLQDRDESPHGAIFTPAETDGDHGLAVIGEQETESSNLSGLELTQAEWDELLAEANAFNSAKQEADDANKAIQDAFNNLDLTTVSVEEVNELVNSGVASKRGKYILIPIPSQNGGTRFLIYTPTYAKVKDQVQIPTSRGRSRTITVERDAYINGFTLVGSQNGDKYLSEDAIFEHFIFGPDKLEKLKGEISRLEVAIHILPLGAALDAAQQ